MSSNQELKGKVALVTGASRGIGRATAITLAKNGANLILISRTIETLNELAKSIKEQYQVEVSTAAIDISKENAVDELSKVVATVGRVDILVNNAGICNLSKEFVDVADDIWSKTFDTNVFGLVRVSKVIVPYLKQQKSGKIVNISSLASEVGGIATSADYVASKGAVLSLSKSLARELAPYGVNVNTIAPGFVKTDMTEHMPINVNKIPLRRVAEPQDIANAVLFLVTEASRCITGTTLDVNCGLFMN